MPDVTPAETRWLRVAAAVLAAGLAGAAAMAGALWSGSAGASVGILAASVLSGVAAASCLGLAAGPARWQRPIRRAWDRFAPRLTSDSPAVSKRGAVALTMVGATSFALIVARLLSLPQNPWDDDQGAFLITAREIQEQGGIPQLWTGLWSGAFAEANRHPLYLALLALNPTVRAGELLSAMLGAVTLALFTACTARRLGGRTAAIACILLGTNAAVCLYSTRVVCEILLMLLCGLAWLLHVRGPQFDKCAMISPLRCATGGALLGLAWLTKGTGLVFFAGYLLWVAISGIRAAIGKFSLNATTVDRTDVAAPLSGTSPSNEILSSFAPLPGTPWVPPPGTGGGRRPTDTRRQHAERGSLPTCVASLICALAAFLVIGSPLIARNVQRFGNPFHNLNSLLLFADRYEDLPTMVDRGLTTGTAAQEYWNAHSLADIAKREAGGLVWEAFIIVRSLGPAPLDDARVLFGLPLVLLAAAGMAARREPADGMLLIWGVVCWGMFAWYVPIAAGERFILPLLGPLLISAARGLASLAATVATQRRWVWAGGAVCWSIVWVLACWLTDGFVDRNG